MESPTRVGRTAKEMIGHLGFWLEATDGVIVGIFRSERLRDDFAFTSGYVPDPEVPLSTLRNATVVGGLSLAHASILSTLDLRSVNVRDGSLSLDGAHIQGDLLVSDTVATSGDVVLRGAIFHRPVRMNLSAPRVDLTEAQFGDGGLIGAAADRFIVHGATFRPTLRLEGLDGLRPVLTDMNNADVSGLALRRIDLSRCDFSSSVGLESIRIERSASFDETKTRGLPSRLVIGQELEWRRHVSRPADGRVVRSIAKLPEHQLRAAEAASAYASLRKSVEVTGDTSGTAGYYLGEMEMRRWSSSGGERAVLIAYRWLASYGLAPGRALAYFVSWVGSLGILIGLFGLNSSAGLADRIYEGLIYSTSNAIVLFGGISRELSRTGEVLAVALGIGSPILLGLTILSLRNQIRR